MFTVMAHFCPLGISVMRSYRLAPFRPFFSGVICLTPQTGSGYGCPIRLGSVGLNTLVKGALVGQTVLLRGNRHGGGVDRPSHFLGGLRTIRPLILPLGGESGRVGSRIGAGSHAAQGQRIGVISVPRRALGLSVIGQGAILRRKNIDGRPNLLQQYPRHQRWPLCCLQYRRCSRKCYQDHCQG